MKFSHSVLNGISATTRRVEPSTTRRTKMQKTLSCTALSLVLGSAIAAQPDCSTLTLNPNGGVYYRDVENFPDPVRENKIDLEQQTKPMQQTVCGFTLTADANSYSFKAKDIATLSRAMGGFGQGWTYDIYGKSVSSGKTVYTKAASLNIALPDGLMHTSVEITGYFVGTFLPSGALMAVKINGGALKPLLYSGSFRSLKADPKTTSQLDLYIKSSKSVVWERMSLDVRNSKMTFYKKAAFPAK